MSETSTSQKDNQNTKNELTSTTITYIVLGICAVFFILFMLWAWRMSAHRDK